jgi:hypothetical protein
MNFTVKVRTATLERARRLRDEIARLAGVSQTSAPTSSGVGMPGGKPRLVHPAGKPLAVAPPIYSLLEIDRDYLPVVRGTKEAGINIKWDGMPLVSGGTGTVTVKRNDA